MSSYLGRHAEWYDLFYADKPYEQEAAFVVHCLRRHTSQPTIRVLELACGTGRHAQFLATSGYEVLATDYSPDMLAQAASRRPQDPRVRFQAVDMRELPLQEPPFDAVVCLFDSIGYVQTNEAVLQVLRGVHASLRPGGLFVCEFWHAAAMLRSFDPLRIRHWTTAEGELLRISRTTLDVAAQTATVRYRILALHHDHTYGSLEESQTNRFFQVQEMRALLSASGLEPLTFYSGFSDTEAISADTFHVVAVARRPETAAPPANALPTSAAAGHAASGAPPPHGLHVRSNR